MSSSRQKRMTHLQIKLKTAKMVNINKMVPQGRRQASTGEIKSNHSETPGGATALSAKEDIGDKPASTNKPDMSLLTTKSESKETVDKSSDSEDKKRDDVECKEKKAQEDGSTKCNNKQGNLSSFLHDD